VSHLFGRNGQITGDILAEAAGFELIIVCDKNMRYQQNLADRAMAILELY